MQYAPHRGEVAMPPCLARQAEHNESLPDWRMLLVPEAADASRRPNTPTAWHACIALHRLSCTGMRADAVSGISVPGAGGGGSSHRQHLQPAGAASVAVPLTH